MKHILLIVGLSLWCIEDQDTPIEQSPILE